MAKVLFLAASPEGLARASLDEEFRQITDKIRAAKFRDLEFISALAVQPGDLQQLLLEHRPDIVHFSGHGTAAGAIVLTDDRGSSKPVDGQALVQLFTVLRDKIKVVLFNACYARTLAADTATVIDCAIGMRGAISGEAAVAFAASFYRALGFGRSVQEAYELGRIALQLEGLPEAHSPELIVRTGVDADALRLCGPRLPSRGPRLPPRGGTSSSSVELGIRNMDRIVFDRGGGTFLENALAEFLGIEPDEISAVLEPLGRIRITLPTRSATELVRAYKDNDTNLGAQLTPLVLDSARLLTREFFWLLSAPELWPAFVLILQFTKQVHHYFQELETLDLTEICRQLDEIALTPPDSGVLRLKQLTCSAAWGNYKLHYDTRVRIELLRSLNRRLDEVDKAFQLLQHRGIEPVRDQLQKANAFCDAIKFNLELYSGTHDSTSASAEKDDIVALLQKANLSGLRVDIAKLLRTAKTLVTHADTLMLLLIDLMLVRMGDPNEYAA